MVINNCDNNPFFSVVIATFNNITSLKRCVASIERQTYTNFELIISDGGSKDGTAKYLESGGIKRLTWFKSSPDGGVYEALNIGFKHSKGEWILVLGDDDMLLDPAALSRASGYIRSEGSNHKLFYANLYLQNSKNLRLKKYPAYEDFENKYFGGAPLHHQSIFMNGKILKDKLPFSENYKIHSDYDLILSITREFGAFKIEDAFVIFNINGLSSKFSNIFTSISEVFSIRMKHKLFPAPPRILLTYCHIVARTTLRHFIYKVKRIYLLQ